MNEFQNRLEDSVYTNIGNHAAMVLSTALNNKVTSRTVSIIVIDGNFYFQTNSTFRKCKQMKENPAVSLCINNIQIEGLCYEAGKPGDNKEFCRLYKKFFSKAYDLYTLSADEILYIIKPYFIQKWIYDNGTPFMEKFDFRLKKYEKSEYIINKSENNNQMCMGA